MKRAGWRSRICLGKRIELRLLIAQEGGLNFLFFEIGVHSEGLRLNYATRFERSFGPRKAEDFSLVPIGGARRVP